VFTWIATKKNKTFKERHSLLGRQSCIQNGRKSLFWSKV
jgi:hypothetical protein